jgi:hypothetical protein
MDSILQPASAAASLCAVASCRPVASVEAGPRWYAVYTRSRHEKCVSRLLESKSVEIFLPMYESVHRWNDRQALVSQPIFPGCDIGWGPTLPGTRLNITLGAKTPDE